MDITTLRQSAENLLKEHTGAKAQIIDWQIIKQRHDYIVAVVGLQNPTLKVVLKLAGREAALACPFDQTAILHQRIATETSIPIAKMIATDTSYQQWPWRYSIQTFVEGELWATAQQQMNANQLSSAFRQLGDAVGQLGSVHFSHFDPFVAGPIVSAQLTYYDALVLRANNYIGSPRLRDIFLSALEQYKHLFVEISQPQLCHEDLHKFNLLLQKQQDKWTLSALLDFDKAWAGCAESDLARMELWTGMTSPDFWDAHKVHHTLDPLYVQRRPIYQLFWCLEFAQPSAQHLHDTRHVCRQLSIPLIEHFN